MIGYLTAFFLVVNLILGALITLGGVLFVLSTLSSGSHSPFYSPVGIVIAIFGVAFMYLATKVVITGKW